MKNDVIFRWAGEPDIPSLQGLFSVAFPGRSITADYYRWQFMRGPVHPGSSAVAERDGRVVAHAGYAGRAARLNGGQGVLFVKQTSMSHPDVRGTGIYSRLLSWADGQLAQKEGALVLSYPNANNHPVQIMRDDYHDIAQIPCLVRVPRRDVAGSGPGVEAFSLASGYPFEEAAELGEATSAGARYGLARSAEYLTWRYGRHPDVGYRVAEHRVAGRLRSLVVWKYYPADDPRRLMVVEWLSDGDGELAAEAFDAVEAHADGRGLAVCTWQNVHDRRRHKWLEKRGYALDIPILYFGAFPLVAPETLPGFRDYREWHVAMGDVDIF